MSKKPIIILLVLVIIAGLFSGCVQGADDNWKMDPKYYQDLEEYPLNKSNVHEFGGTKYYFVQGNDQYKLYFDDKELGIALVHKSGEAWYSNPSQDVISASTNEAELRSQLYISIIDKTDASQRTMNSYNDCVKNLKDAIEFESDIMPYYITYNDEGGLRVKYVIGDILPDYIIPAVLPVEVYQWIYDKAGEIYQTINSGFDGMPTEEQKAQKALEIYGSAELSTANPMTVKNVYTEMNKKIFDKATQSQKDAYKEIVPGVTRLGEDETVTIRKQRFNKLTGPAFQALFDMWYQEHKDQEEYAEYENVKELRKAWDAKYSVVPSSGAMFMIPIDYVLTQDGLQVLIKNDEIVFNESKYVITHLDVLKYLGCGSKDEQGYMFTPDGSGAIVNFNNGKVETNAQLKVQLYGIDRGKNYSKQPEFSEQGHLPVFGIKKATSAMFAIIQKGESVASVVTDVVRKQQAVNYTYSSYRLIETDDMAIFGDTNPLKTYAEEKFSGDISILYGILPGENITYGDMAEYYRNYLIANGELRQEMHQLDNVNFNLELAGAVSDTSAFLGIRYDYLNSLTTYSEAQKILAQLTDGGVKGINLRYKGWANNGLFNQAFNGVSPLGELGGWSDYRKLEEYASQNGITLYPECELILVYKDKLLDGFMSLTDVSRQLSRSNAMYFQYNLMHPSNFMHQAFIARPQKVQSMSDDLLKNLQSNKISAVSLGKLGNMLTGDYHIGAILDRSEVQEVYAEIFDKYAEAGLKVAAEGGNAYALSGTDVIYGLPNQSSGHYMADETVPFYQMVVHGYIQYSGEVINQSGDAVNSVLKAIETGSGLSYRWMYAPNKDTNNIYFEDIYATCYESWIEDAIVFYNRYNQELGHTASLTIVDHNNISSTLTSTTYSDGTVVYVNYDQSEVTVDGKTVNGRDYLVVKGV